MLSRSESKVAATCALAGSVVLFIGTYLHPLAADPNEAVAAFSEYAADRLWVASHLMQLVGVVLMVAALLLLVLLLLPLLVGLLRRRRARQTGLGDAGSD